MDILLHEYLLTAYGVILWELEETVEALVRDKEQIPFARRLASTLRGLGWAGLVVIFDDELLARYNEWAAADLTDMPFWGYILAGFFIDILVNKFKKP